MDLNPTFGHKELLESISQSSVASAASTVGTGTTNRSRRSRSSPASLARTRGAGDRQSDTDNDLHHHQQQQQHMTQQQKLRRSSVGGSGSVNSSSHVVDERYRRLCHRLSLKAHGGEEDISMSSSVASAALPYLLRPSWNSGFEAYRALRVQAESEDREPLQEYEHDDEVKRESRFTRTSKVAKKTYSDHGRHVAKAKTCSNSLLKRLTFQAEEKFRTWREAEPRHEKSSGESSDSPLADQHYTAFSELALNAATATATAAATSSSIPERTHQPPLTSDEEEPLPELGGWMRQYHQRPLGRTGKQVSSMGRPASKGLLSAVLEGHSDSQSSVSGLDRSSVHTSPSLTISTKSTKDSRAAMSSLGGGNINKDNDMNRSVGSGSPRQSITRTAARGQCLTNPSDPVSNDGLDNAEGNLIVHENDAIVVPRKSIHTVRQQKGLPTTRSEEFRIQSLLGQGTFAQVFRCLHVQTGQNTAIKIVKNRPAYTRQAGVEIDVFRALQEEDPKLPSVTTRSTTASSSRNYMVNLVCYFMHESHLCLVFELLGLNLYEVLKRRQFRGLPLPMVRTVVQQAVAGFKDLSQKSIVHCDLKPENILLVSDDVVRAVVGAGEPRRMATGNRSAPQQQSDIAEERGGNETSSIMSLGGTAESGATKATSSSSSAAATIHTSHNMPSPLAKQLPAQKIKLIDFGSACFEGYTAHTYIQSRFYRSPEVLIGLPYDSAVDMWSLGCVAAELFLGLPILPGVHEHDQLGRIHEMISKVPDWMLDQGSKSNKYYVKFVSRSAVNAIPMQTTPSPVLPLPPVSATRTPSPAAATANTSGSPAPVLPQWRLKTQQEYIGSLSPDEIRKKGGLEKLEKQPGNRYFKQTRLADILIQHAQTIASSEDRLQVAAFIHFLYGILDPDPWKRWTAFQACQHPFVSGDMKQFRLKTGEIKIDPKEENHANRELDFYWKPPLDPHICRRKLLNVQKMREKQQAIRRSMSARSHGQVNAVSELGGQPERRPRRRTDPVSPSMGLQTSSPMDGSPIASRISQRAAASPPNYISGSMLTTTSNQLQHERRQQPFTSSSSYTGVGLPGTRAQLVSGSGATPGRAIQVQTTFSTGPQSFTGLDIGEAKPTPIEGDFAYALQRPGVVPGTGLDTASLSSHHTASLGPQQQNSIPSQQILGNLGGNVLVGNQDGNVGSSISLPQAFAAPMLQGSNLGQQVNTGGVRRRPSTSGRNYAPSEAQLAQSVQSFQSSVGSPMGHSFGGVTGAASVASSVTMQDTGMQGIFPQTAPIIDQQQQNIMLTAQPQFPMVQQQFLGVQPGQPQIQQPQLQPQIQQPQLQPQPGPLPVQQIPLQQQQVFLVNAPGGGYYYMTTSAMGQPMILQPVAVVNQQQQMMMDPQGPGAAYPADAANQLYGMPSAAVTGQAQQVMQSHFVPQQQQQPQGRVSSQQHQHQHHSGGHRRQHHPASRGQFRRTGTSM